MKGLNQIGPVLILVAVAALGMASDIKWNTDLKSALKIAKKTKKTIMIDFYGEH